MFPPKKRKLYTPITPPSDEENEANRINATKTLALKPIPEKISTFKSCFNANFVFKPLTADEMAQNREWKLLKPIFIKHPVKRVQGRLLHRFNSIDVANSIPQATIVEIEPENDDQINVLDVIAQRFSRKQKIETQINPHPPQQNKKRSIEALKSIFMEHDDGTTANEAVATDNRAKSAQTFISSHLFMANSEDNDEIEPTNNQSVNKTLISKNVLDEWIRDSTSAAASTSSAKANPINHGIIPQTPSLSSSKLSKIKKKGQLKSYFS